MEQAVGDHAVGGGWHGGAERRLSGAGDGREDAFYGVKVESGAAGRVCFLNEIIAKSSRLNDDQSFIHKFEYRIQNSEYRIQHEMSLF